MILFLIQSFLIKPNSSSLEISGLISLGDVHEESKLYLELLSFTKDNVNLEIYEDDSLFYKEQISFQDFPFEIALPAIEDSNQTKKIHLNMKYSEANQVATQFTFDLFPISKDIAIISNLKEGRYTSQTPSFIRLYAFGTQVNLQYEYETFISLGKNDYQFFQSRYFDFSLFEFKIESKKEIHLTNCKVRFFTQFLNSDLFFQEGYTYIDVPLIALKKNHYRLENDFRFYIDRRDGNIYETQNLWCEEELMPFFFPLSVGFHQMIPFEIILEEIGQSKMTIFLQNQVELGNDLREDCFYINKKEKMEGIEYEYV